MCGSCLVAARAVCWRPRLAGPRNIYIILIIFVSVLAKNVCGTIFTHKIAPMLIFETGVSDSAFY